MTPQEFSAKIKEKNPSLQNVDDVELARKVVAQHPEFKLDVDFGKETPKPIPAKQVNNQDGGFFSNIKSALLNRGKDLKQTYNDAANGNINPASAGLQTFGSVAGAINDVIGEGVNALLPKVAKDAIGGVVNKIADTSVVQNTAKAYSEFKSKHPEAAKDLESAVNIGLLFPGYKGAEVAGSVAEKSGNALINSADKSLLKQSKDFSAKLVKPVETKATKESAVGRTTEVGRGIFKRSIVAPTEAEKFAGQAVQKVPGISPSKTYQQNYNLISSHNTNLAKSLESDIANTKFIISKKEVIAKLDQAATNLSESPLVVGDAEKMAKRLIEGAKKIINENPGTGSGLLKARKEFDSWVKSQKPKVFEAGAENALSIANREIRNTFNDILESKAPSVELKKRLLEQHALYNALDAIKPKAAIEADTAIGRGLQRVGKVLGVKNKAVQATAAIAGIGGLGAAATFAPPVAAIGIPSFLLYKGAKQVLKPGVRKAAGQVLKGVSKVLPK